ncbi:MAG: redox-sensing transcriptional repressor Rex, partial [bacterium]
VGHLGQAVANYRKFENLGLKVVGLFDVNPRLIGMTIREVRVRDIDEIPSFVNTHNVKIGIIATPTESAQITADHLLASGIKGIWNFSPINITAPPDVFIQNEHLSVGLMTLSYKLNQVTLEEFPPEQ